MRAGIPPLVLSPVSLDERSSISPAHMREVQEVLWMYAAELVAFVRRLFHLRPSGPSFENPRYLLKWLFLSTAIGVVAGFGALLFFLAIQFSTGLFLGKLVGYLPHDPAGEGTMGVMSLWAAAHPWLLPLVTTAGGLLAGIIVFTLA